MTRSQELLPRLRKILSALLPLRVERSQADATETPPAGRAPAASTDVDGLALSDSIRPTDRASTAAPAVPTPARDAAFSTRSAPPEDQNAGGVTDELPPSDVVAAPATGTDSP